MRRALALLYLTLAAALALPAVAAPPDIAGVWVIRPREGRPPQNPPKLTPSYAAAAARRRAAVQAGYVREVTGMICGQSGGPQLYQIRSPFEIFSGFGRMTFIFETEMNNQPHTIYMEEKVQPQNIYPSFNGHSIGHWEGKTLVIDTVGYIGRGPLIGQVPRTTTSHVTERFTLSPDGQTLTNQLKVEDPQALLEPWTATLVFDHKPNTEERFEVWCDLDMEALKATDLEGLKDVDPEIAILLDGSTTDPAVKIAKAAKAGK